MAQRDKQIFPFPTLDLDFTQIETFLNLCRAAKVRYGLGAKPPFQKAVPGRDYTKIDCSGFVREALRRASVTPLGFPDGSVRQREWIVSKGFKRSSVEAARLHDDAIRIAFLRPQDSASKVGHVVLVRNGLTYESHGGVGPNSRGWFGTGWQAHALVYVLTAPR